MTPRAMNWRSGYEKIQVAAMHTRPMLMSRSFPKACSTYGKPQHDRQWVSPRIKRQQLFAHHGRTSSGVLSPSCM